MNKMRDLKISKLTMNIGVGEPGDKLEKAFELLKTVTGANPVKTKSNKRIPKFNVRPGIELGVKVTLRKNFEELLKRLLLAKEYNLKDSSFDDYGNISFGIDEYVHVPGLKYDPKIPMFGFNVTLTLSRAGYRIKDRRLNTAKIPRRHIINKEEAIDFMKNKYGVKIV
ncbi:MAG: 50S ribosomal protein L5 [Nanoarchaeota archaeon]|nr:50S ribosomal protein L5 [Nanoarchaeota archaeon]